MNYADRERQNLGNLGAALALFGEAWEKGELTHAQATKIVREFGKEERWTDNDNPSKAGAVLIELIGQENLALGQKITAATQTPATPITRAAQLKAQAVERDPVRGQPSSVDRAL